MQEGSYVLGCGLHAHVASDSDFRGTPRSPHLPTPIICRSPHLHRDKLHKAFSYLLLPGLTWALRLREGVFCLEEEITALSSGVPS